MLLRSLLVLALTIGTTLFTAPSEAAAPKKKAGHKAHGTLGTVTIDDQTKTGTIEVKGHAGKKKGTPGETTTKTFQVTDKTKVELAQGKGEHKPGSLSDLTTGKHVLIESRGDQADVVVVIEHAKGKKAKKKAKKATT